METKPKNNTVIMTLIILGIIISALFGMRLLRSMRQVQIHRMPPPASTDVEEIHDWMPIHYISNIYGVPEPYLYQQAGIEPGADHKKSLTELNEIYFPDQPGLVLERVKAAVSSFQQNHPTPERPPQ